MRRERPELLIPASSLEVLKTAVIFGADAVYIGGEAFGLRAKAHAEIGVPGSGGVQRVLPGVHGGADGLRRRSLFGVRM